ncbi:hypothetical protein V8E53_003411 [Lactarius tabidus]
MSHPIGLPILLTVLVLVLLELLSTAFSCSKKSAMSRAPYWDFAGGIELGEACSESVEALVHFYIDGLAEIIFKNKAHLNFEAKKAVHPKIDLEEDKDKDNDKIDKPFDMSALTMPNYLRKAYRAATQNYLQLPNRPLL